MRKFVIQLLESILTNHCVLRLETIDHKIFGEEIIASITVINDDLNLHDLDIRIDEGIMIIESWADSGETKKQFDPYSATFVKKLTKYLLAHCNNKQIILRYKKDDTIKTSINK